jgi:hypothetical protein
VPSRKLVLIVPGLNYSRRELETRLIWSTLTRLRHVKECMVRMGLNNKSCGLVMDGVVCVFIEF